METQGQMLAHTLQFLVYAMSRPDNMALGLRDLGRRHAHAGVRAEHCPLLRQVFLETVRSILGAQYTTEVEAAWATTIDSMITTMLAAHA